MSAKSDKIFFIKKKKQKNPHKIIMAHDAKSGT